MRMKTINGKAGRPPKGYTNSQWQQDFIRIKVAVQPLLFKNMKVIPEQHNFISLNK